MLLFGASGSAPPLERYYFEGLGVRSFASPQSSLTLAFTVPAGLPSTARAFLLCGWLQNAAGTGVVVFGGDTLDGADELVAPTAPSAVATPDVAAYTKLNPTAGANNLVITAGTDIRSIVAGLWIFGNVDASQPTEADFQLNSSTAATTITGSMDTEVPTYLLSLAVAQGFDVAPSSINGGFTELLDGVTSSNSTTTDMSYNLADRAAAVAGTYASTVTFAGSDGRGLVQLAVRGK
jgi:hypothetical protein